MHTAANEDLPRLYQRTRCLCALLSQMLLKMDYRVSFPNAGLTMHIENLCELTAPRTDPLTGEKLHILFGVVTTKGAANEIQLAKLIKDIEVSLIP